MSYSCFDVAILAYAWISETKQFSECKLSKVNKSVGPSNFKLDAWITAYYRLTFNPYLLIAYFVTSIYFKTLEKIPSIH